MVSMTAAEVKQLLSLQQHPKEGGWYARTYESAVMAEGGLRRAGTAIYYLLEPGTFSEMHKLKNDEVFHFYAGDPVEQLQLLPDGTGRLIHIGNDLHTNARPQVLVPGGAWQGARLVPGGAWALLGCTVTPGFEYQDYESGSAAELCAEYLDWSELIRELTRA